MSTHNSGWQNKKQPIDIDTPVTAFNQLVYADTYLSGNLARGVLTPIGSLNRLLENIRVLDGIDYVPSVAGYYKVEFELQSNTRPASELVRVDNGARPGNGLSLQIFKNGELIGNPVSRPNVSNYSATRNYVYLPSLTASAVVAMNGVDDAIRLMAQQGHLSDEVSVFGRATIHKIADAEIDR